MTQKEKMLKSLTKRALTAKQIVAMGIASPSKVASRLREDGINVQLFETADTKGRVTRKYTLA